MSRRRRTRTVVVAASYGVFDAQARRNGPSRSQSAPEHIIIFAGSAQVVLTARRRVSLPRWHTEAVEQPEISVVDQRHQREQRWRLPPA